MIYRGDPLFRLLVLSLALLLVGVRLADGQPSDGERILLARPVDKSLNLLDLRSQQNRLIALPRAVGRVSAGGRYFVDLDSPPPFPGEKSSQAKFDFYSLKNMARSTVWVKNFKLSSRDWAGCGANVVLAAGWLNSSVYEKPSLFQLTGRNEGEQSLIERIHTQIDLSLPFSVSCSEDGNTFSVSSATVSEVHRKNVETKILKAVGFAEVSPTGKYLAYFNFKDQVEILNIASSASRVVPGPPPAPHISRWSAFDKYLLLYYPPRTLAPIGIGIVAFDVEQWKSALENEVRLMGTDYKYFFVHPDYQTALSELPANPWRRM
jgi:hypothetical protein